jgi:hypothetical protein
MSAKNITKQSTDSKSRIPDNSVLFGKIVPALLAFMGILTIFLVLFAVGVLLGLIKF